MAKGVLGRVDRVLELLAVVGGVGGASQFSGFVQHYIQNLAGRLAELRADVGAIEQRAQAAALSVDDYVRTFQTAANPVFQREGEALQAKLVHAQDLTEAYDRLQGAGLFELPITFVRHLDMDIATDTWRHFQPNVPVNTASWVYAGMGAVLAILLYWLVRGGLDLTWRLVSPRRKAEGKVG